MIKFNQNYDKLLQEIEDLKKQIKALNDEQVKQRRANEDLMYNLDNDNLSPTCVIRADHISLNGKTIDLTSGNITINSTNFTVDENGNMWCRNADVSGTITATDGTFNGTVYASGGSFANAGISDCSIQDCTADTMKIKSGCQLLSDATSSSIKTIPVGKQTSGHGACITSMTDPDGYSVVGLMADSPNGYMNLEVSKDAITIRCYQGYWFRFNASGMQYSINSGSSWASVVP